MNIKKLLNHKTPVFTWFAVLVFILAFIDLLREGITHTLIVVSIGIVLGFVWVRFGKKRKK